MSSLERQQYHQSGVFLDDKSSSKVADAMRSSMKDLQTALTCQLCQSVMHEPVALTCGHTFCCSCIDCYTDNQWTCPVKTCGMSVAMKAQDSKFRTIHPSYQTVATSWNTICQTLMQAPDFWWQDVNSSDESDYETAEEEACSFPY